VDPFRLPTEIVDRKVFAEAATHLRERGVTLPRLSQLADPGWNPSEQFPGLADIDPDAPHPANLARVHWFNDTARSGRVAVPAHVELPASLTGTDARIVVALGSLFPMIGAHKVQAAYACLVPRLVSGQFAPASDRAVWPSTGNYCRGGIAISRILGCHGVAVLPEGMSAERFAWLDQWVEAPEDIVRTPGTESNVKEIYDACDALAREENNDIINQFSEFGNYIGHYLCTGTALSTIFAHLAESAPDARLAAFVSATGSAGTLGAGDYLKETHGTRIAAVEPVECPTMLYNGYGEHNIQGIGDKHIPLIHNTMNTDLVVGVSDRAGDALNVVFNTKVGQDYLTGRRGIAGDIVSRLDVLGLSGIANVLASIKVAKRLDLGPDDVIMTVATDSAALYSSEREKTLVSHFGGALDEIGAAETYAQYVLGLDTDHVQELGHRDRLRLFNLAYYTWVEQRGIALADFDRRKHQSFWRGLIGYAAQWDAMIDEMNAAIAAA